MLENKEARSKTSHELVLLSRESLNIKGIKEIINFDENEVYMKTVCGDMIIDGTGLHVNVLNVANGDIEIRGKINGINYSDNNEQDKKGILGRIFG